MAGKPNYGLIGCGALFALMLVLSVASSIAEQHEQARQGAEQRRQQAAIEARKITVPSVTRYLCLLDETPTAPDKTEAVRVLPGSQERLARTPRIVREGYCPKHLAEKVKLQHIRREVCPACDDDARERVLRVETMPRAALPAGALTKDGLAFKVLDVVDKAPAACREKICKCMAAHGWDARTCEAVGHRQVYIGMTAEQARAAWGRPSDINRTTTSGGVHEQWVYGEYGERGFLYFDDGTLRSIQN